MARPSSLVPTDWEVRLLQILWKKPRASVDDVREELRVLGFKRSESAVRKMLNILVEKGFACSEVEGRITYFTAVVKRAKVEKTFIQHIAETLFGGSKQEFVLRAIDETKVNDELVQKMKEIIQRHEDDAKHD